MENIDEEFRTAALQLSQRAACSHSGENDECLDQLMSGQMRRAKRRGWVSHSARLLVHEEPPLA